jgi:excisionase family DNA binding protein
MTIREAAGKLGLSVDSLYREVASGRLAAARIGPSGRKIFVSDEDLADYLRRCRTSAAPSHLTPAPGRRAEVDAAIRKWSL